MSQHPSDIEENDHHNGHAKQPENDAFHESLHGSSPAELFSRRGGSFLRYLAGLIPCMNSSTSLGWSWSSCSF